jgi:hypothetical protein
MRYEKENFSFKQWDIRDGDEFYKCNFTQLYPDTEIGKGCKNLKFERCNLLNCKVPKDATVTKCLRIQKSFCAHLHPKWNLSCPENCEHVTDTNKVTIDGVVVSEETVYQDLVVA